VGNELISALCPSDQCQGADPGRFREAVDRAAQMIREAYLAEVRHRWPWGTEPPSSLVCFLANFVTSNVLHRSEAYQIEREFAATLQLDPSRVHAFDELAQIGLVGYSRQDGNGLVQSFRRVGETVAETIPRNADWYFLHPVLYGEPLNIRTVAGHVVGPGLPVDPRRLPHPSGPVSLVKPADVDRAFVLSWLHLSDIHFGAGDEAHRADLKNVAAQIVADARCHAPRGMSRIFVTGDIAFSGRRRQYDEALVWLAQVAEAVGLPRSAVRVVPGNHDVDRARAGELATAALHSQSRQTADFIDRLLGDAPSRRQLLRKLAEYQRFAASFPCAPLRGGLDWTETLSLPGVEGRVRVLGLSTVWVSDAVDGRRSSAGDDVFVPNMQLARRTLQEACADLAGDEVPLLLTHHPVEWLDPRSRGILEEQLAPRTHVHLCGHLHRGGGGAWAAFGGEVQAVTLRAGATHGDPTDERLFGYSWGALAWNPAGRRWQIGWAPRVFARGQMRADRTNHDLDPTGFAWRSVELPWRLAEAPPRAPEPIRAVPA
jgi:hypothetical protein